MTIYDLVKQLSRFDPDMEIEFWDSDLGEWNTTDDFQLLTEKYIYSKALGEVVRISIENV